MTNTTSQSCTYVLPNGTTVGDFKHPTNGYSIERERVREGEKSNKRDLK